MSFFKWIFELYWDSLLGKFITLLETWTMSEFKEWWVYTLKGIVTFVLLLLLLEVYLRGKHAWHMHRMKEESIPVDPEGSHMMQPGVSTFIDEIEATKAPEQTIAALKKSGQYLRLGEVCASLGRHKESAKAFERAGDPQRAAEQWARAGKPLHAAKMLQKAGDLAGAARFLAEGNKQVAAAQLYLQLQDYTSAATEFSFAGKFGDAAAAFQKYFETAQGAPEMHIAAADQCFQFLQKPEARGAIPPKSLALLTHSVALCFAATKRYDLAATLFAECGDFAAAGDVYAKAGKLEQAAECMRRSGQDKAALRLCAQDYERRGLWVEAGLSYKSAEDFRKAGDCFSKGNDAARAAECFEKAGEFFGAGFAYIHVKKWEQAIKALQRVPEGSPHFEESRGLLGRAFFEAGQFADCAATLENHLIGERVRKQNIEYFWMLALAFEQLGDLAKSRDILLKVRSINVDFRDVSQRLSNIETRISISGGATGPYPPTPTGSLGMAPIQTRRTAVMDMVESQLGKRYKLEKELGRGGMGVVYLAQDIQLNRPVALKFLGALVDDSDEFKQRFIREAQAAAQVSHPNIISIYDIGSDAGKAYIAMEYIEGVNLHQYTQKKGKLAPREAANIIGQVCAALDAIHAKGIVHRDIKPDNVLLAKGGLVKLMDFGLAKGTGQRLTATNVVMGTPCYMSPEQALGRDTDSRSDLYALGMVLYETLTGKPAFRDGDILERQVKEMPPPPSQVTEDIPTALDEIIMRAIAKRPEDRIQTAREFQKLLRNASAAASQ